MKRLLDTIQRLLAGVAADYKCDAGLYGPTVEEEPDYYAQDERGQAFLREWHSDYRKLL